MLYHDQKNYLQFEMEEKEENTLTMSFPAKVAPRFFFEIWEKEISTLKIIFSEIKTDFVIIPVT